MDTKMLFFDIDGTLITEEDGKMPDSTREALHLAHKRGHLLFINTGRTKKSLPKELLNMGFDGYICGCGTHIFLRGEELLAARLSNSLCKEVAKEVRSHHVPVFMRLLMPFIWTGKCLNWKMGGSGAKHFPDRRKRY